MKRATETLAGRQFDILVIGGGAAGAAVAREAALRGYDTALIERDDFGSGASAHCFKVVHGGIRYLQHADIPRMRASCRERAAFLSIAPHLVSPLPFAIPTFGRGKASKWFLGTGMKVYDTLTRDVNAHVADPSRRIAPTRFLDRGETLNLFPGIDPRGLTGAAVFEDGQMYSPPRLVLAFIQAASELGATVANYVEAEKLLIDDQRVFGIQARDRLSGESFDIHARLVINASGPWAEGILQTSQASKIPFGTYSRDACFVISRSPTRRMALAIQGQTRDADALLARNARHLFLVPWRNRTLVGVWHSVVPRDPDRTELTTDELRAFMAEINAAYPSLQLQESEVTMTGFGLVPFGEAARQGEATLSFGKQSRLIDHRATHAITGLISTISVRYTVARCDAAAALDLAAQQLEPRASGKESMTRALPGGAIDDFASFAHDFEKRRPAWLVREACAALTQNYGTNATRITDLGEAEPALQQCLTGTHVTRAEITYVLNNELVQTLADVVFRRTDLGTAGHPGDAALDEAQELLARELHWSESRARQERAAVNAHLRRYMATPPPEAMRATGTYGQ